MVKRAADRKELKELKQKQKQKRRKRKEKSRV
jgi:hypothetical protein